jgi:hypothetical protein
MRFTFRCGIPLCAVLFWAATAHAGAPASSPDVTGNWTGTVKFTAYNSVGKTKVTSALTAELTQSGTGLMGALNFTAPGAAAVHPMITGQSGDFVLYGEGTDPGAPQAVSVFFDGACKNGTKITGTLVSLTATTISVGKYTLTKNVARLNSGETAATGLPYFGTPRGAGTVVLNGKVSGGKSYLIATTDKPSKFAPAISVSYNIGLGKADVTFDPGLMTQETFSQTQVSNVTTAASFSGTGGQSEEVLIVATKLNLAKGTASGIGWIFGGTRLVKFKTSVKNAPVP